MDVATTGGPISGLGGGRGDFGPNGATHAQKNELRPHLRQCWVIPPEQNADFVMHMEDVLEVDYPQAARVVLVCDNLNTHTPAALYEAFPPAEARRLVERLEIHNTPKHGSWLNIAECELSVMTRQCLDRRIPDLETHRQHVESWYAQRNNAQKSVDWRFTTADARIKLIRLYPQIQTS